MTAIRPKLAGGSEIQRTSSEGIAAWCDRRPILAIMLVSLFAVVLNCHPIIFGGKSFVSPCTGADRMLYPGFPTLPEELPSQPHTFHGSDTGAILWGIVPSTFVQVRALFEHGELPLWNRYTHAGEPLLPETVSMFGEPLHFFVLLCRGQAWAWDIAYVVAKGLFCLGWGLLAFHLIGNVRIAMASAALGAYCGAFYYIANHPSFFVFCYSPWVMLTALRMLKAPSLLCSPWPFAWLAANFACFNAGMVELAVALIGGLNLTALVCVLAGKNGWQLRVAVLPRLGLLTLVFLAATSPVWLSFLVTEQYSFSRHMGVSVEQRSFWSIAGLLDDMFHQAARSKNRLASVPGGGALVWIGACLSLVLWRPKCRQTGLPVFACFGALWIAIAYGVVPGWIIGAVPFFNRVGHIDADFSYLAIFQLHLLSVYGFAALASERDCRKAMRGCGMVLMIALFAMAMAVGRMAQFDISAPWYFKPYVLVTFGMAFGACAGFVALKRNNLHRSWWAVAALVIAGLISCFRFGYYGDGPDEVLMVMGDRVKLDARSPAIEWIKANMDEPGRVVGLQKVLWGDFAGVYGVEDIRGCSPLTNPGLIELVSNYPGMRRSADWVIEIINPPAAQPLLNLMNVRYLLAKPRMIIPDESSFQVVARKDLAVIRNPLAWPRAFFSSTVVSYASLEALMSRISKAGNSPFVAMRQEQIKTHPALQQLERDSEGGIQSATNYHLLPNSTAFEVRAPSAGVVCLTEAQAPDFSVKVNNEPGEVLTVNHAFKGVYLDRPGNYRIEFTYRPRYWGLSCALFWVAVIFVTGTACYGVVACRSRIHKWGSRLIVK